MTEKNINGSYNYSPSATELVKSGRETVKRAKGLGLRPQQPGFIGFDESQPRDVVRYERVPYPSPQYPDGFDGAAFQKVDGSLTSSEASVISPKDSNSITFTAHRRVNYGGDPLDEDGTVDLTILVVANLDDNTVTGTIQRYRLDETGMAVDMDHGSVEMMSVADAEAEARNINAHVNSGIDRYLAQQINPASQQIEPPSS